MLKRLAASGALPHATLIAVGPAEDEWLYHDELLALAAQHPSFHNKACGGEWDGPGGCRGDPETAAPPHHKQTESDAIAQRGQRVRATNAGLFHGDRIRSERSEN